MNSIEFSRPERLVTPTAPMREKGTQTVHTRLPVDLKDKITNYLNLGLTYQTSRTRPTLRFIDSPQTPLLERHLESTYGQDFRSQNSIQALNSQLENFPDTKEVSENAISAYKDFLTSDVPVSSRKLATGKRFQQYVEDLAGTGKIGPYFLRFIDLLQNADLTHANQQETVNAFSSMDDDYSLLTRAIENNGSITGFDLYPRGDSTFRKTSLTQTKKFDVEVLVEILANFRSAHESLFKGLTDTTDPNWHQFVLAGFPELSRKISLENMTELYQGHSFMQRAKDVVSGSGSSEHELLLGYLFLTDRWDFKDGKEVFDDKIKNGDLDDTKTYTEFGLEYFNRKDRTDFMPREDSEVWAETASRFVQGTISAEDLKRTPALWDRLRKTYFSLPKTARGWVESWMEVTKEDPRKWRNWRDVMLSPALYEDTDIVIGTIEAGFPPATEYIAAFKEHPELLPPLKEHNRALLEILGDSVARPEVILNSWIDHVIKEVIDVDQLPQVRQGMVLLRESFEAFYERIDLPDTAKNKIKYVLYRYYGTEHLLPLLGSIQSLLSHDIFPAPALVGLLKEKGEDMAYTEIERLLQETDKGNFDVNNPIQKELEYIKYVRANSGSGFLTDFDTLTFKERPKAQVELSPQELMEADAAAFEAAQLFGVIKERKGMGRKVGVIGNMRYGAHFIVDPLQPYLEREGIGTSTYYIHSATNNEKEVTTIIDAIDRHIDRQGLDDLFIVDGTPQHRSGEVPRLPRSLEVYSRALAGKNKYSISYWIPSPKNEIQIGFYKQEYIHPDDSSPQIILASPMIDPASIPNFPRYLVEHKPGSLDDPEKFARTTSEIGFTNYGFEELVSGRTEQQFVDLVRDEITRLIPHYFK